MEQPEAHAFVSQDHSGDAIKRHVEQLLHQILSMVKEIKAPTVPLKIIS